MIRMDSNGIQIARQLPGKLIAHFVDRADDVTGKSVVRCNHHNIQNRVVFRGIHDIHTMFKGQVLGSEGGLM